MTLDSEQRTFLDRLLETPSPSGFETRGQRVWLDYVSDFADEVWTDDYGNAVAIHEGNEMELVLTGHADEVGFIVRRIDDDGFVRIGSIGGADRTVSKGQHVTIHADEPVSGVVGQTAIHLREKGEETYDDIEDQYVDIGVADGDEAESLVSVGDPVTFSTTVEDLHGSRISARGMDNRIGVWAAAEGLRRAVEADADATVYAVSTIQEEVGLQGAKMVGFDLDPDAVVAVDVTHATDSPGIPDKQRGPVELGSGPVVTRGSANHPVLVDLARDAADDADVAVQLQAAGSRTGTDADAFYTSAGGTPALNLGLPNRYMHTPVEVIDSHDLDDVAALLSAMAVRAGEMASFAVDI
ncbi:zinc-binding metallopeptidase family protein [Haloplanus aerogenes]|uniref:Endoglucanase n=1 Tax=Haloplanus aerogenes TaxID=660522 RepID=A0A3M0DX95_9EURY|nr:M42 family peptidase [Haloplanus aerogenes]AZH25734.1 M42 family peptidase [Haloplanus aerogenes]RMB25467.1 endoglucanase [Haloplanus aerogenes]